MQIEGTFARLTDEIILQLTPYAQECAAAAAMHAAAFVGLRWKIVQNCPTGLAVQCVIERLFHTSDIITGASRTPEGGQQSVSDAARTGGYEDLTVLPHGGLSLAYRVAAESDCRSLFPQGGSHVAVPIQYSARLAPPVNCGAFSSWEVSAGVILLPCGP